MKKRISIGMILMGILFFTTIYSPAQNLVPNPSFEDTVQCPFTVSQISYSNGWSTPSWGTPDYFNSCASSLNADVPQNSRGWENPKSGVAYAGVYTGGKAGGLNYREYIQIKLTDTLLAGVKYYVSFYVSPGDSSGYRCNNIGAFLSQTAVSIASSTALPYIPQVANTSSNPLLNQNGWILVADTFTATGGELFITIGNFNNGANSDTVFVGGSPSAKDYAFYYIDDVSVKVSQPDGLNNYDYNAQFRIYPNPANTNITLSHSLPLDEKVFFEFYDVFGKLCLTGNLSSGKKETEINISTLNNGIYYCQIKIGGNIATIKKLVIAR